MHSAALTFGGARLEALLPAAGGIVNRARAHTLWKDAVVARMPSRALLEALVPHLTVFRSRERGIFILQLARE